MTYFALDRVFTGNMTGNVLFLGFALVGVPGIPFLNDAIALVGFVLGSMIGGRAQAWAHRLLTVIAIGVGAALGAGAIQLQDGAAALRWPPPSLWRGSSRLSWLVGAQRDSRPPEPPEYGEDRASCGLKRLLGEHPATPSSRLRWVPSEIRHARVAAMPGVWQTRLVQHSAST